jgi:hypothetical protein
VLRAGGGQPLAADSRWENQTVSYPPVYRALGSCMADRRRSSRRCAGYIQETTGSQSSADQLAKLADLRDRGVITAEEFEREKAKILA